MTTKERKFHTLIEDKRYLVKKLSYIGVDKKYTGYFFLIEIMNILINELPHRIISFSREVYPLVADRYNVSVCSIERDIRNVIDKCWSQEMAARLNVFRLDCDRPCCRDFIFMIKNFIMRQIT